MEDPLLLAFLRRNRIAVKYSVITTLLLVVLVVLLTLDAFAGADSRINETMSRLAKWGAPGMFLIALPSNMTLVILVPYNLPMFTLVAYADSWLRVLWIGVATGLGAGIGEVTSYAVAHAVISRVDDLEESALFRWTRRTIGRWPRVIPLLIWLASATPIPDLMIIIPIAMVNYRWQKMILPMITGKILQNVVVAFLFYFATTRAQSLASGDVRFDVTAMIVIVFVMVILYQIEKARVELNERQSSTSQTGSEGVSDQTC